MEIFVGNAFSTNAINYKRNNNSVVPNFVGTDYCDVFQKSNNYLDETTLRKLIVQNPNIKEILSEKRIPLIINTEDVKQICENHGKQTQEIADGIIKNLPQAIQNSVDKKSLKDAAYLHDIGKSLIPREILNKTTKLTPEETEIMHLHSDLGYEILKGSDIDPKTLFLIKYHHQNANHNGYPSVKKDFWADINLQILNTADIYSALTEDRPYKNALPKDQALGIIYKEVKSGNIHPFVFKALVKHVNSENINTDDLLKLKQNHIQ